ncbi:hypothetical protein J6590_007679 [Homalodisca vitripennis]|nr:hypothetical protein J6590_007679 [Homalodisca vitripennis]
MDKVDGRDITLAEEKVSSIPASTVVLHSKLDVPIHPSTLIYHITRLLDISDTGGCVALTRNVGSVGSYKHLGVIDPMLWLYVGHQEFVVEEYPSKPVFRRTPHLSKPPPQYLLRDHQQDTLSKAVKKGKKRVSNIPNSCLESIPGVVTAQSRSQITSTSITITDHTSTCYSGTLTRMAMSALHRHRVMSSETMGQEGDGKDWEGIKASHFRPQVSVLGLSRGDLLYCPFPPISLWKNLNKKFWLQLISNRGSGEDTWMTLSSSTTNGNTPHGDTEINEFLPPFTLP